VTKKQWDSREEQSIQDIAGVLGVAPTALTINSATELTSGGASGRRHLLAGVLDVQARRIDTSTFSAFDVLGLYTDHTFRIWRT